MICTTQGIVLQTIKYSDSSIIARIFTKQYGIGSFIMNNVRGKRSKMAYFQPLSHVNISIYKKNNATIHRIKSIEFEKLHVALFSDLQKASIASFLGEVLSKIIQSEETNDALFNFICNEIEYLSDTNEPLGWFHILFLLKLMQYFGIHPSVENANNAPYFDMYAGCFSATFSESCLTSEQSTHLKHALSCIENNSPIPLQKKERIVLLETIINYYRIHVQKFSTIQSIEILQSVFA